MITFVGAGPGAEDLITVRGQRLLKEADIVIVAAGRAGVVGADYVREGQTIIDVGINVNAEGKLCGDIGRSVRSDGEGPWGRKRNRTSAYRRSLPLWCDPRADG